MTFEEALAIVAAALAPQSLSELQINVFQGAWNKESYQKISLQLNHEYSYIKDVGAELWQLLTQRLGIQVTKLNLQSALKHYVQQGQMHDLTALPQHSHVDWGEAPDVSQFYGRAAQLATLEQWVMRDRCRLIAIAGMGGIGKTMLVTQLTQQLVDSNQFEVVIWRSLRQAPSLVDFLGELLQVLCTGHISPETSHNQACSARLSAMVRQLLEQLRHHRCLLILDHVEAVLCGSELIASYQPGYEDYGWLFQQLSEGRHQSSVLLTGRETPTEIAIQESPTAPVRLLRLERLSIEEGKAILAAKGLSVQAEQAQELIERYQGNPLALKFAATAIQSLYSSNIAAFLAKETQLFKDIHNFLANRFDRLSLLEQQVMYWLTIYREAAIAGQLQTSLLLSIYQVKLRDTLTNPSALMTFDGVSNTQQFMLMEYITKQLNEQVCEEVN